MARRRIVDGRTRVAAGCRCPGALSLAPVQRPVVVRAARRRYARVVARGASTSRFERSEGAGGARVDSRIGSPAEYLAKLWTLFGAPDGAADGRAFYGVRDRETGQEFEVSTNAAGISYGAAPDSPDPSAFVAKGEALEPVLAVFDALLAATPLADCTFELQVGDGRIILGAKAGVPFEHDG